MKDFFLVILLSLSLLTPSKAQFTSLNAHSHNDYLQKIPFFLAYNHHFGSIEADIWEVNGELMVAHEYKAISKERSLDSMYLMPIVRLFHKNGGRAWADQPGSFILLIDVKSEYELTLRVLVEKLKKYPNVFDRKVNSNAVRVVITGNRPDPEYFTNYPDFISFDGKLNLNYTDQQRQRIAMFSENLTQLSSWKDKEPLTIKDETRLKQVIDSVHHFNYPIRFWNAPDEPKAWKTLMELKVDYINTDHITELSVFLSAK